MKLASIEKITELQPIDGADRIEAARVLGFWTVVKRGEFKPGDFCVWHNPDTVVDVARPAYDFLKGKGRLRTCKIRGQVSQGLALPPSAFPNIDPYILKECPVSGDGEGFDVSDIIGIKKYEKPETGPAGMNMRGTSSVSTWPSFLQKTDETNIQSYPSLLRDFLAYDGVCVLTKKYDGSSATFYRHEGKFGVCSRNQELDVNGDSIWAKMARQYGLDGICEETGPMLTDGYAVQGEIVGPGIQGNPLKLEEHKLIVFDVYKITEREYLGRQYAEDFCRTRGLEFSDAVAGPMLHGMDEKAALELLLQYANVTDYGPGAPCEGLVLRSYQEQPSRHGSRNRLSAKVMSQRYVEE